MSEVTQLGFDYQSLPQAVASEVRAAAERIKVRMKRTAEDIIEIGKDLIAVKPKLEGYFEAWFEEVTGLNHVMAYRFLQAAERFGNGELHNVTSLSPTVLYALAAPCTPDEVVAQAIDAAEAGDAVTLEQVKQWKRRSEDWRQQYLTERDAHRAAEQQVLTLKAHTPAERIIEKHIEVTPSDYDALKRSLVRHKSDLEELKKASKKLIDQAVRDKLRSYQEEVDAADDKIRRAESYLKDLQAKIDRYTDRDRELQVHLATIEKARIALAVLAANLEGFEDVIDTDNELRLWRSLAVMMRNGAGAIEYFVGDSKPALAVVKP